jgi:hypothetical protein
VEKDRGVALILTLLVLSFPTVIGSALLTTSAIDTWISDNYKTAIQNLYLAEAGIDYACEMLRSSPGSISQLWTIAAGPDGALETSSDPTALERSDDRALVPVTPLIDGTGRTVGSFHVWLRNDGGDGVASLTDTNEVLRLLSIGRIGNLRKVIETTVEKGRFPESASDPRLQTISGLEALAASIERNATDRFTAATLGNFGNPADYRVGVSAVGLDLGPATGYGVLLVRGVLRLVGDTQWNGIVVVVGQGILESNNGARLTVNGGLFVARTRASGGALLSQPVGVTYSVTDAVQIKTANRAFPYTPIATRER